MPRTTATARKSTGGTAPRKVGVAVHTPLAPSNLLVPQNQRRQVSHPIGLNIDTISLLWFV